MTKTQIFSDKLSNAQDVNRFLRKMSGTVANRPALKKLLRTLNEGDTLVVWKLDRLGRSMRNWYCWWTNSGSAASTSKALRTA